MKDKVLIKLIVPEIDKTFDLFLPVNELIWKTKKLITKSISDITNIPLIAYDCSLVSKDTGKIYRYFRSAAQDNNSQPCT